MAVQSSLHDSLSSLINYILIKLQTMFLSFYSFPISSLIKSLYLGLVDQIKHAIPYQNHFVNFMISFLDFLDSLDLCTSWTSS